MEVDVNAQARDPSGWGLRHRRHRHNDDDGAWHHHDDCCRYDDHRRRRDDQHDGADRESAEPVGPASRDTVEGGGFPSTEGTTALLVDISVARHDGFERIVLEFEGADPPGYRVGYLDPPVREDFSGKPVELAGDAVLEIRVVPGAGFDPMSDDARKTYTGPLRFTPDGTEVIEKLVRIGDFEAHLTWVPGLTGRVPFAVEILEDPVRLVMDVVPDG